MKLSGELDYRIRYDVEHDLFHAQNVFNAEYIKPTFIEYVQKLEKENAELKEELSENKVADCHIVNGLCEQLTKAKGIIRKLVLEVKGYEEINGYDTCESVQEAEQFLKDSEVEK